MKTHIFQDEANFHKDNFRDGFNALVRLFIDNGITINMIKHSFDEAMVDYCTNQNPKISNMEVSVKTGIDRRIVSKIRNGSRNPVSKQDKYSKFISVLKNEQEYNNDGFPIHIDTFNMLFYKNLNGSNTANQTLNILIDEGYIKRKGDELNVLEWGRVKAKNNSDVLLQVSKLIRRIISVKFSNIGNSTNLTDRAVLFDDIPTKFTKEVDELSLSLQRKHRDEMINAITPFRDSKQKLLGNCHEEYGFYNLTFRDL